MRNAALFTLFDLWSVAFAAPSTEAQQLLRSLRGHSYDRRGGSSSGSRNRVPIETTGRASIRPRASYQHRFLSNTTSKFAVDGKSIPEVDFDVGESYAGLLPISEKPNERDNLYFWFFPTANPEHTEKKEITLWLNGGPVTVGFSKGNATIRNEDDLAEQFLGFWKNFIKTFSMQGWKVYVVAESYGRYYGPFISSHMVNAKDSKYYNLAGLMVYDGIMFDGVLQGNIIAADFVEQHYDSLPFNDDTMAQIHNISDSCGYTEYNDKYLRYPPFGPAPLEPPGSKVLPNGTVVQEQLCNYLMDLIYEAALQLNPCFNIYNVPDHCPQPYDSLGNDPYFNREDVKKAIHAPAGRPWSECVSRVFNTTDGDESASAGNYELPNVIDKTKNIILAHGAQDMVLPLNGVLLGIQNMTWGGKLGFQTAPSDPFYVPDYGYTPLTSGHYYGDNLPAGSGVMGTVHTERGLTLVVTQPAGHEGPAYGPAGAFRHLEKLLGRMDSLSSKTPFTLPQLRNVTQRVGSLGKGTVKIPCRKRDC